MVQLINYTNCNRNSEWLMVRNHLLLSFLVKKMFENLFCAARAMSDLVLKRKRVIRVIIFKFRACALAVVRNLCQS